MKLGVYFSIDDLLLPNQPPLQIAKPPDVRLAIPYNERSWRPEGNSWQTFYPRNIVSSGKLPAITISQYHHVARDVVLDMMTAEWLDVEAIVQRALSGTSEEHPLGRNYFKFPNLLAYTRSNGLKIWRVGSRGYHALCIDAEGRLNLISLQSPGRDSSVGHDMADLTRELALPIRIDSISDILAFSDEAAKLAVQTEACEAGCCTRSVRIFGF